MMVDQTHPLRVCSFVNILCAALKQKILVYLLRNSCLRMIKLNYSLAEVFFSFLWKMQPKVADKILCFFCILSEINIISVLYIVIHI